MTVALLPDREEPSEPEAWAILLSADGLGPAGFAALLAEFGSGRGALFVPEMDEQAFPPIKAANLPLRVGRRAIQMLLGLRHPK